MRYNEWLALESATRGDLSLSLCVKLRMKKEKMMGEGKLVDG